MKKRAKTFKDSNEYLDFLRKKIKDGVVLNQQEQVFTHIVANGSITREIAEKLFKVKKMSSIIINLNRIVESSPIHKEKRTIVKKKQKYHGTRYIYKAEQSPSFFDKLFKFLGVKQ